MKKDDILVVKPTTFMRKETDMLKALHEYILEQKVTGVIVLPSWVDVIIDPGDVEIKVGEPDIKVCDSCMYCIACGIGGVHHYCSNGNSRISEINSPKTETCDKWKGIWKEND